MLSTVGTSWKQQNTRESAQDAGNTGLKATVELWGCEDKKEAAGPLESLCEGSHHEDERRSRNVEPDEDAEARSSEAELKTTLKS